MIRGGWNYRLTPLPGELLSSCLARNAHAHGSAPCRFLDIFWRGDPVWNRDFDRDPAGLSRSGRRPHVPDWLDDVAIRLGVCRAEVEAATLAPWRAQLAGTAPARFGDTPLVLAAGVFHRTRLLHGLQYCPECLDEGEPHFRKNWRLGFVVACDRHGTCLSDACPHCCRPIVPHRSMTTRMTDCHACGRAIADGTGRRPDMARAAPEPVLALQQKLLALLDGEGGGLSVPPWTIDEAFGTLRTLLSASAARPVRGRLNAALNLVPAPGNSGRMRFSQVRLAQRVPWLATVAAWTADWPRSFHDGAIAAGLTGRSFARLHIPPPLAAEVSRLPTGVRRDRTWEPVLEEPVLRRLRRTDLVEYRQVRAQRILAATGRGA